MSERLKGKVAVVTGASRGIGRAASLALAKQGAHVVVAARTVEQLASLVAEIEKLGVKAKAVAADLTQPEEVAKLKTEALAAFDKKRWFWQKP